MNTMILGVFLLGLSLVKNLINISFNELLSLLSRVFEALYGHEHDYQEMAQTIFWLECHGHSGINKLIEKLPELEAVKNIYLPSPNITKEVITVDCCGGSLFTNAHLICDLAFSEAENYGTSKVFIINAKDPYAIIGYLGSACNNSLSSYFVTDKISAFISPRSQYPTIYSNTSCKKIQLTCAKNHNLIDMSHIANLEPKLDVIKQKSFYEIALKNGLSISTLNFKKLNLIADRILVPSTDASRLGAGE